MISLNDTLTLLLVIFDMLQYLDKHKAPTHITITVNIT